MLSSRIVNSSKATNESRDFKKVKRLVVLILEREDEIYKTLVILECKEKYTKVSKKQIHLLIEELVKDKIIFKKPDLKDMRRVWLKADEFLTPEKVENISF